MLIALHQLAGCCEDIIIRCGLHGIGLIEFIDDIAWSVILHDNSRAILVNKPRHLGKVLIGKGNGNNGVCDDVDTISLLSLIVYSNIRTKST